VFEKVRVLLFQSYAHRPYCPIYSEATNKYCMTDNLQLNNRTLITDNAIAAEQLLFGAFNQGCTSCGKAAFGLYNQHLEVDGKRLFDSVCGVGFVGAPPPLATIFLKLISPCTRQLDEPSPARSKTDRSGQTLRGSQ
jgi:hypothetical protein